MNNDLERNWRQPVVVAKVSKELRKTAKSARYTTYGSIFKAKISGILNILPRYSELN